MKRGLLAAAGTAALAGYGWGHYRRARKAALEKLRAGSDIRQTACGSIEYAAAGQGAPVLVLHGILGHYDHGLISTRPLHDLFTIIAPSRPGYGRTPLATGRSAAQQADALAALLDALEIERVPLIVISSAGPVGLQFALRYPDRCGGLVLLSAISRPLDTPRLTLTSWLGLLVNLRHFDFGMWLAVNGVTKGLPLLRVFNPDLKRRIYDDPVGHRMFTELVHSFFPSSTGRDGFVNDVEMFGALTDDTLTRLRVPTLVMHGAADIGFPAEQARRTADLIPGARLVVVGRGANHPFYVTHRAEAWPPVEAFLKQITEG